MEKKRSMISDTSIPDPLNTFAKKIGKKIDVQDGKSKETLKEMLVTSLMPTHHRLECLPYTSVEKCEELNEVEKVSEKSDNEKEPEGVLETVVETSKEEIKECSSIDTDEILLSPDSKWLKDHFQVPLKMAIKEVVSKKPYDPVRYLGFWLLHYKRCQERNQCLLEKDQELNYIRSLIREPTLADEECILPDRGEEEETRDWNFEHYDTI
ncbi:uncharacterized protein LOC143264942 [Megachile rotundata]|uniref:uncharacterized protein LOC143264942 n=1 Tax=Megachile rotundata TaxID=143995 RepID=UPI003FD2EC89